VQAASKPLIPGLFLLACRFGVLCCLLVTLPWRAEVLLDRRGRRRAAARGSRER